MTDSERIRELESINRCLNNDLMQFSNGLAAKASRRAIAELENKTRELEAALERAREALEYVENFRLAYRKGKLEMYAEGGVVSDAAMRLLPCNEGEISGIVRAALPAPRAAPERP